MPDAPGAASVQVKICGLARREDVTLADHAGANYLGVVLTSGFGRSVDPSGAGALVADARATKVAVLVNETAEHAAQLASRLGAGVIQLHGRETPAMLEALRRLGSWRLWKSVRARSASDVVVAAQRYLGLADALLVEGWKEGVVGGGGVGVTAPPGEVRAAIGQEFDFVLAGGLTPETVRDAIERFSPDVVDVSSGVERRPRRKDPELVRSFIAVARASTRSPQLAPGPGAAAPETRP